MAIIIGSARADENGKITNGVAGDQKQTSTPDYKGEVSMQNFYVHKKGWYILRAKSTDVANKIAEAMKQACNNVNIGYDQNGRYGIINNLKKYGSIAKIAVKTEADCSSTIRACCIQAGFDPGDFNTSSEVSVLLKTGKFMDKINYTSSTVLYTGDILVTKTKGHTVAVVQGNARKNSIDTTPTDKNKKKVPTLATSTIKFGSIGTQAKYLQQDLNYVGKYGLVEDGEFGIKSIAALMDWQKKNGLEVDGIYGKMSQAKMKEQLK